jgi:hypothetical protein
MKMTRIACFGFRMGNRNFIMCEVLTDAGIEGLG